METGKSFTSISFSSKRLGKFAKKVTWSEQLTDVRVMTPLPSVFEHFAGLVFLEEDEDQLYKDEGELSLESL